MFPDFKNSFPKKSFWHFDLHFVLKTFISDKFQITEIKQQTRNQQFSDEHLTFQYLTS